MSNTVPFQLLLQLYSLAFTMYSWHYAQRLVISDACRKSLEVARMIRWQLAWRGTASPRGLQAASSEPCPGRAHTHHYELEAWWVRLRVDVPHCASFLGSLGIDRHGGASELRSYSSMLQAD